VPDHLSSLLPFCKKVLTAVEEKRVLRVGAVLAHAVDVKLVAATQAELRRPGAAAASSTPFVAERYASSERNT
jgi:hypothetical protein